MPIRPSQPVSDTSFWRERLEIAKRQKHIQYSVYLAGDDLWNRIYKVHHRIIDKVINNADTVLDLGCGYGRMAEIFNPKRFVGVDVSPDLIAEAKERYPKHKFIEADLLNLPFKDKEFDWGLLVSVRGMIQSNLGEEVWDKMDKECRRVCKKILVLEYGEYENRFDNEETIGKYEILC
jgi:ubiquinone/menaquinone biosynthesis C-methylase UbiE